MVNNHKKGQKKELLCQKELEADGWKVVFRSYTIRMGPFFKGIDFADLFDVIAIKQKQWIFISCKHANSEGGIYHKNQLISFWREHCDNPLMSVQLWVWHAPKWTGRGKNKKWVTAHWDKTILDGKDLLPGIPMPCMTATE